METVRSVLAQSDTQWRLLIVDDGSPHPAAKELIALTADERARIEIIEQSNGGVSAARNRGLAAVSSDAEFVAFVDSDDHWESDHLMHAIEALGFGAAVFWGRVETDGTFDTDSPPSKIVPAAQREKTALTDVYTSQHMPRILTGEWWRHMHLSTLVLRAELARQVRFDETLRNTEDFDFFRKLAEQQPLTVFSDQTSVHRGTGDNIWHNLEFSDVRIAQERFNTFRQLSKLSDLPDLTGEERDLLRLRREVAREQFVWNQHNRRATGNPLNFALIWRWVRTDPWILRTALRLKFGGGEATELPVHASLKDPSEPSA